MRIRNDVVVSKNPRSKDQPWTVRWWGKYDLDKEKQSRHSKSFPIRKQAERYAEQIRNPETKPYVENRKLTLEELCDKYLKAFKPTLRFSSYTSYEATAKRLKRYFGPYCHISSIRKEDALTFINCLDNLVTQENASDSTRSRFLRQCQRMFKMAVEWEYIRVNPFAGIKLGKISRKDWLPLSMEQFGRIMRAVDTHSKITKKNESADRIRILRLKTFYSVMYYCGLRFGEAANLMWDNGNIDFERKQINIVNRAPQKDVPGFVIKDHEARSIAIPQKVVDMLQDLKNTADSPFVFLSAEAYQRMLNRWHIYCREGKEDWDSKSVITNARRDFKTYCRLAGLKDDKVLTLHSLRKGFGTNMASLGIPAKTLQDLMGHSSIITTMEFYVKTLDENKRSAAEQLNAVAVV